MTAPLTRCFQLEFRALGRRSRDGRIKRGALGRFLKREARRRLRAATQRFLARGDWDGVVAFRPVTGWDAF